jgi:orotidine-5'-phosphate decarboxylase
LTRKELVDQIRQKKSFLCIGLDSDPEKIPPHLLSSPDPIFEFNKEIIDNTHDLCAAYKINTAFYEARGIAGWESLKRTFDYIPQGMFSIADAKRGDIGNTSAMYASAFFDPGKSGFDFDAVTVNPYMGEDSVQPFLQTKNKWAILLALTSNKGSRDFQAATDTSSKALYEIVLEKSKSWGSAENMMYVVGATHPEIFNSIRKIIPDHFLLVPGIGAQGGDLELVCKSGMNHDYGLLVNASRTIIYASAEKDFAAKAREQALKVVEAMRRFIS